MAKPGPPKGTKPAFPLRGRPVGVKNKVPTMLKEAILEAAEAVGQDGKGKDGLVGYLKFLAVDQPGPFTGLLGKVLPLVVAGDKDNPLLVKHESESAFERLARGLGQAVPGPAAGTGEPSGLVIEGKAQPTHAPGPKSH